MSTIKHKFRDFENKGNIEILILGTFNPDTPSNPAEFFYGRGKNYFWNLLPKVFNYKELKNLSVTEKKEFIDKFKIGFADIIQEVDVESGEETNYSDDYIDSKVNKWIDFENFLKNYVSLRKVFFTRKTFKGIPKMKEQIDLIKETCLINGVDFSCLPTPARFDNQKKLNEWIAIIKK
jgi:G:T/U-mismatch repair DNA glycosylase